MPQVELPTVQNVQKQGAIQGSWGIDSLCEMCDGFVAFDKKMELWRKGCLCALVACSCANFEL